MCGRFVRQMTIEGLWERHRLRKDEAEIKRIREIRAKAEPPAWVRDSYNVSPYQWSPVIRRAADGEREVVPMRWSIIPPWEKKPTVPYATINARQEDILQRPSYRAPFRNGQRILVPASGFYEWLKPEESV